jgi:hypothetical protein
LHKGACKIITEERLGSLCPVDSRVACVVLGSGTVMKNALEIAVDAGFALELGRMVTEGNAR